VVPGNMFYCFLLSTSLDIHKIKKRKEEEREEQVIFPNAFGFLNMMIVDK
jgi:hypothetical protein